MSALLMMTINLSEDLAKYKFQAGLELQSSVGLRFLWEDVVIENTLKFWHT